MRREQFYEIFKVKIFYENFKRKVGEILENEGVKFEYKEVTKLNGTNLTAIIIWNMEKNANAIETPPMIYLNLLYQKFFEKENAPYLAVQEIKKIYNESMHQKIILENFMKPENIRMMVINKMLNKALLENLPHIEKEDLAVIYMYKQKEFSAKITYELMKKNNLTPEELLEIAYENMKKDDYSIKNVINIISDQVEEENNMYVATNKNMRYGASAIMNTELLKQFGKEKGYEKFYILPSSIHEIIIIPYEEKISQKLKNKICSVNSECVEADEILSDNLYIYSLKENDFKIVD